ncbi:MAG: 8-oxoguanine deaminase [Pseudomonadota bacterium]
MRTWIKNPLAVLTPTDNCTGIVVEGTYIDQVLVDQQAPDSEVDSVIDASDCVVLPGLINTHHHYYQTLTRALPAALNKPLFPWLKSLYPVWAGLTPEMILTSTELASAELLLSGCTTSSDHHYLYPKGCPDAFDLQVSGVKNMGIRSVLCRGSMSLGEEQGGLPPSKIVQSEDDILTDCERVIHTFHKAGDGAMIQVALAPCSPFSVTPRLMTEIAALARQHGVRLHTHLAETEDETQYCLQCLGARPLDFLESVDWVGDDVWLAHGIHFNDEEIQRLGQMDVCVCHCPGSNMMLSSGHCRTLELEHAGCPVGLAVDGSASNDHSNMMQEIRQAFLLQRLQYGAEQVSHLDALRWATAGSARCIGRQDIGVISEGMQADIAIFSLQEPRFSGSGDALAALVLCGASQARDVLVAGKLRVKNGEIIGVDLGELTDRHRTLASELTKKLT